MESEVSKKISPKILILDDVIINVEILQSIIEEEGYETMCALSVQEAIDMMNESLPQLILSDISMPEMNGLEFCRLLKSNPRTRDIPVIFITVLNSSDEKEEAFTAGAVDFIPKPFDSVEVIMRIRSQLNNYAMKQEMESYSRRMHQLITQQRKQIEQEQKNILLALAKVIEKRHLNKGTKPSHVAYNSRLLAQGLQFLPAYEERISDEFVDAIEIASKIRDIGKFTISNTVLLKDEAKEKVLEQHTEYGAGILEEIYKDSNSTLFIDLAVKIARSHHERWDGTGYPQGLKGEEIPLAARIVAVSDSFNSLMEKTDTSNAENVEACVKAIQEESGKAFEPAIVDIFSKLWKQMKFD